MQDSDQFATPDEESQFHEEIIETDDDAESVAEVEDGGHEEDGDESEEAKPVKQQKKTNYVEFTTPEQKERVGQLTREKHEAIRRAQELERRLSELEKQPEPPKEVKAPTADPVTDPDAYAKEVQAYSQYLRDHTKFELEQEQRQQQSAAAEQARREQLLDVYKQNMQRLKVNPNTLAKAADVCQKMGISPELTDHLLEDEDGPALVAYLGTTGVDDLAEMLTMRHGKAISYLERVVREKAQKKPVSKAPPPPTKVKGTRQPVGATAEGWEIS